jgi:hypothetical protein
VRTTAFFLTLLLAAASAEARMEQPIPLASDARAKITVGSCFDNIALNGYAPIDVTITNYSGQTRQWDFDFASPGYTYGPMASIQSSFSVTVENNGTRTIALVVPTILSEAYGQNPLRVEAKGYGTQPNQSVELTAGRPGGKPATRFVAISESLGTANWSSLSKELDSNGMDLVGSTFNPDDLPVDWRGLSGVTALWLSGAELDHLSAAQRQAVQTWMHAGGRLMLCGVTDLPKGFEYPGFGQVTELPSTLDVSRTRNAVEYLPKFDDRHWASSGEPDPLAKVKPNVPLLGGIMGLFAFIVGPVNIFVLARRRRERLLWTTPLISLCASGILMGVIVLQDGSGGHGMRSAVVCLFPQSRNAVMIQEQVSHTGLLLGSSFQTRDPVCISPLKLTSESAGRPLRCDGNNYGKDWFVSRAAQAQRIVTVVPTRAEITLFNGADVAATGAAPVIVSSFDATLQNLYYTDVRNRTWHGIDVRTGQKQTLQFLPVDPPPDSGVPQVKDSLRELAKRPGSFWATSVHSSDYVATLGSIKWKDEPITYVGPVTGNP